MIDYFSLFRESTLSENPLNKNFSKIVLEKDSYERLFHISIHASFNPRLKIIPHLYLTHFMYTVFVSQRIFSCLDIIGQFDT